MEERVDPADIEVEEPETASFPLVGRDKTPDAEQLARGAHGNGSWDLTDASVEVAYAEVHQAKKEAQDERRHFFNEAAKDALLDAIQLHHRIVRRGLEVMDKIESGAEDDPVTAKDMAVLSMAQKSSKELADRGIGKSKSVSEDQGARTTILALLHNKQGA